MAVDKMDVDKPKDAKVVKGKKKDEEKESELSDEDIELKKNLDLMVERVGDSDPGARAKITGSGRMLELLSCGASPEDSDQSNFWGSPFELPHRGPKAGAAEHDWRNPFIDRVHDLRSEAAQVLEHAY